MVKKSMKFSYREKKSKADELEKYFKIKPDIRDLDYEKYTINGKAENIDYEEYASNNNVEML